MGEVEGVERMATPSRAISRRISLIPGFAATYDGQPQEFRATQAKLIAFLALQGRPIERSLTASTLWPFVSDARAASNLRTVMWRVGNIDDGLIAPSGTLLRLEPATEVDLREHQRLARRVLNREPLDSLASRLGRRETATSEALALPAFNLGIGRMIRCLGEELLVHWFDDWVGLHQERWRQLRLHALDSLSMQLTDAGYHAAAIDAATAAVAAEPLRESGHRALIMAHLAEGNASEAVRTHEQYRQLLEDELGIAPSYQMYELVSRATDAAASGHPEPTQDDAGPPHRERRRRQSGSGIEPEAVG